MIDYHQRYSRRALNEGDTMKNEKMVIFRELGTLYLTDEENYTARIRNARKVTNCKAFDSAEEIIEYFIKYFKCTHDDFIVLA